MVSRGGAPCRTTHTFDALGRATEPSMARSAFAPAKVNLFLHVGPVGADGYHPLSSLMVFADVGDTLSIQLSAVDPNGQPLTWSFVTTPAGQLLYCCEAARLGHVSCCKGKLDCN